MMYETLKVMIEFGANCLEDIVEINNIYVYIKIFFSFSNMKTIFDLLNVPEFPPQR